MRVESVYELAYHYFEANDFETSYMYLIRADQVEIPVDLKLYVRREIYEYKIPDLLGAVSYHVKAYDVGRKAVQRALRYKPNDPRLLANQAFYDEL